MHRRARRAHRRSASARDRARRSRWTRLAPRRPARRLARAALRTAKPSIASTWQTLVPPTRALVPIGSTRASGSARCAASTRRGSGEPGPARGRLPAHPRTPPRSRSRAEVPECREPRRFRRGGAHPAAAWSARSPSLPQPRPGRCRTRASPHRCRRRRAPAQWPRRRGSPGHGSRVTRMGERLQGSPGAGVFRWCGPLPVPLKGDFFEAPARSGHLRHLKVKAPIASRP